MSRNPIKEQWMQVTSDPVPAHPRPVFLNDMVIAANQKRYLSRADVASRVGLVILSLTQFDSQQAWLNLADTVNMSEAFARARVGSGPQADEVVLLAQQALYATHQRYAKYGTWTMESNESEALHWLLRLHSLQLVACSLGEFHAAMKSLEDGRVENRRPMR